MSQNIGELYKHKEPYVNRKEMLIPYMFWDRSGDDSGYAYAENPGYGFQENSRVKQLAKIWMKLVNGIENIDEQQRELGVTYMRWGLKKAKLLHDKADNIPRCGIKLFLCFVDQKLNEWLVF